jgi:hypothetical protein
MTNSDFQSVFSDCFLNNPDQITSYSVFFTSPTHLLHLLTILVTRNTPLLRTNPKQKRPTPTPPRSAFTKTQYPGLINVQNKHQSKITIFRSRKSINPSFFSFENTRLTLSRETPTTVANSCTFKGISIL